MTSRWAHWSRGNYEDKKGFSAFIVEQETPAQMARRMGLQSDGSGGYIDPSTGQVVARTVNNELVFYDPQGGAISAQSDGAQLTQAQPSWRDPVTGELTVPPGQPESPEEISAVPDPVPAQAPPGYNAFMNRKKKEMYAAQVEMPQEQPEPEVKQIVGENKTYRDMMEEGESPTTPIKPTQPIDTAPKPVVTRSVTKGKTSAPPKITKQVDTEQIDDEEMEAVQDERSKYLNDYDKLIKDHKSKMGPLTDIQNANADRRFKALRDSIGKIEDPNKRKAFMNAVTLAYAYSGRVNSGAGKNALGKVDHEVLQKNRKRLIDGYGEGDHSKIKEFVESTRFKDDVTDDEALAFYEALPTKLQNYFQGAGKISDTYDGHYLGSNRDGSAIRGRLSGRQDNGMANGRLRGLLVAKLLLQQGGKDGYTGLDLDLDATDLEHVLGFNNKDHGTVTREMKDLRENINNFILTASNLNQTKLDKNMSEWFETEVDRLNDFTDEDFKTRDQLMNESNTVNDKAKLVNQLFLNEDGNALQEKINADVFDQYSKRDREIAKSINSRISKFAKEKGVTLPKVKNRIAYEMIKALGLGGYMKKKSGRGNQGKLDDKVYSAFLSTLMRQSPEGRERLMNVWREGREIGSQAAFDQQNDGAAKKALLKYLKDNQAIDSRFLNDKEFKRILQEMLDFYSLLKEENLI